MVRCDMLCQLSNLSFGPHMRLPSFCSRRALSLSLSFSISLSLSIFIFIFTSGLSLSFSFSVCSLSRHHCDTTVMARCDKLSFGPHVCLPSFCSRRAFSLFRASLSPPPQDQDPLDVCVMVYKFSLSVSLGFYFVCFLFSLSVSTGFSNVSVSLRSSVLDLASLRARDFVFLPCSEG